MFAVFKQSEYPVNHKQERSSRGAARAADILRADRHLARVKDRALQDFFLNVR